MNHLVVNVALRLPGQEKVAARCYTQWAPLEPGVTAVVILS